MNNLNSAYEEIVKWRGNIFRIPYGCAGKSLVSELALLTLKPCSTTSSRIAFALHSIVYIAHI